ncbi:hypothetical protein AB0B25_09175 [Nocardia sp. NPDC049190]|uniref:hypothetical protein n=1 Tax=Nocardia sp. NPDC049190 TaxID=3155650 RepID=UPI0033CA17FC
MTRLELEMEDQMSPNPKETDVHLVVEFGNVRFDYTACATAASLFMQECRNYRYPKHLAVVHDDPRRYPRMPNERLYLER